MLVLKWGISKLSGRERDGIAVLIADHWRSKGDLSTIQELFAADDAEVKKSVLNCLPGEPGDDPAMGPGITALAVEGAIRPEPEVRIKACSEFQGQCDWGVEMGLAAEHLLALLSEPVLEVRRMDAFATRNGPSAGSIGRGT